MEVNWKRLIPACVSGNILELYDYILYAYFSKIISNYFFPSGNNRSNLLLVFSFFAAGCLMRPIGGIIFGFIGDRFGRKQSLIYSIGGMTIATSLICVIPSYSSIGIISPILLLISRITQGLSMCGEEVGSAIYLMENSPKSSVCFSGSIILGSVYLGLCLASIISFFTINLLPQQILYSWGWKIPFLISFPLGVFSLFLRLKQKESFIFDKLKQNRKLQINPIFEIIKSYKYHIFNMTLICSYMSVSVYLYAVFLPSYISKNYQFGLSGTMLLTVFSFFITAMVSFITGMLSDKYSYNKLMHITCYTTLICTIPLFVLLSIGGLYSIVMVMIIVAILVGISAGSLMPYLILNTPTNIRFTGAGLSFNLSMSLFGSTAPFLIYYLSVVVDVKLALLIYLSISAVITLLFSKFIQNKKGVFYG